MDSKKDRKLFESIFTNDNDFFTFYPDSKSTVKGWEHFTRFLDQWMDRARRNIATGYEIRDLRVVISSTGDVSWFSAVVDDGGTVYGNPWEAKDIRWTGVLEIRGGKWVIVQQHLSKATDRV